MQRRRLDPPAALKLTLLALLALLALGACKHESAGTAGDLGRTSESSPPIQPSPAGATGPAADSVQADSVRADSAAGQLALPPTVGATTMTLPSIGATVLVPAPPAGSMSSMPAPGSGLGTVRDSTVVPRIDSIAPPHLRADSVRPLFPAAPIPGGPGMPRPGFDTSTTPPAPFPHPAKTGPP